MLNLTGALIEAFWLIWLTEEQAQDLDLVPWKALINQLSLEGYFLYNRNVTINEIVL